MGERGNVVEVFSPLGLNACHIFRWTLRHHI
jgi:hypothetical protein